MPKPKQYPAHKARKGLLVLEPSTGLWAQITGVEKLQGAVRLSLEGIPALLAIRVPSDQTLTFRPVAR